MSRFLPLLLSGGLLLVSAPAFARGEHHGAEHNQIEGVRIDLHANLDRHSVFGSGVRLEFALVPDGFIRGTDVNDELALSVGADLFFAPIYFGYEYYGGGAYLIPIGAVQWNFYFGDWSIFPEVGVAVHVGFDHDGWQDKHGNGYGWIYPEPDVGFGARYHFDSNVALLLKISTPGGLQVGVVF